MQKIKTSIIHFFVFLISLFFLLINSKFDIVPNTYQGRDLNFALEILKGNLVWFGPDLTGGGKLPGPFYYYVLAVPLFFLKSLSSVIFFQTLLAALSAYILWRLLCKIGSEFQALVGIILYLFSFSLHNALAYPWNPSFLPIFMMASLYFYFHRNSYFLLDKLICYLILGFAVQIHFSISLIAAGMLIYDLISNKSVKNLTLSLLALLVPLIPYCIWYLINEKQISIGEFSWDNGFNSLKYHFKMFSLDNNYTHFWEADWFYFFKDLVFTAGFGSLILYGKKLKSIPKSMWIILLTSFPLVILHFSDESLIRYTFPFFVILIIIISLIADNKILLLLLFSPIITYIFHISSTEFDLLAYQSKYPVFIFLYVLFGLFWIVIDKKLFLPKILFLLVGLVSLPIQTHIRVLIYPQVSQIELADILAPIIEKTGWDYTTFRKKTFMDLILAEETDFRIVYNFLIEDKELNPNQNIHFVLIAKLNSEKLNDLPDEFPVEIKNAISNKDLVLESEFQNQKFKILFFSHPKLEQELFWNNIGHNYIDADLDIRHLTNNWKSISECNKHDPKCIIYFGFKIDKSKNILKFYSFGAPLGSTSQSNNPSWVTYIERMNLKIVCAEKYQVFEPVQIIGHRSPRNSRFLAPYSNYIGLPCPSPTSVELKIHTGSGHVLDYETKVLSDHSLFWDLTTQE